MSREDNTTPGSPLGGKSPEQVLLEQLAWIETKAQRVCRRGGFFPDEAEEFASVVKIKLLEDDYAVLRKFQGKSALRTFLTTVISHLFQDYRIARWGKWRPSAEAKRQGELAQLLERLLYRDGYTFHEASQKIALELPEPPPPKRLEELAALLKPRTRRRFEGEESLDHVQGGTTPEDEALDAERRDQAQRTGEALGEALSTLGPECRVIVKMRFKDGFTVRHIADSMQVQRRRLYTRMEQCLKTLRQHLESVGLQAGEALRAVGWLTDETILEAVEVPETESGPS